EGGGAGARSVFPGPNPAEMVGVVGAARRASLAEPPIPDLYFAGPQQPAAVTAWLVRTAGDPDAALPAIRSALSALEPGIAFMQARSMSSVAAESAQMLRFTMWLFCAFAGTALVR